MREMRVLNSSPPFASDFFDISCVLLPSSPSIFSVLSSLSSFFLSPKCQNDRCPPKTAILPLSTRYFLTLISLILVSCTHVPLVTHSAQSLNEIFHLDTFSSSFKTVCNCNSRASFFLVTSARLLRQSVLQHKSAIFTSFQPDFPF